MHYCIGDVHGCYDDMTALLNRISGQDPDARFIFLGDFPDRGPKVWETVQWAMNHITPDGRFQSVQGNHEQMILQWYLEFCEWYKKPLRFTSKPPRTGYDFFDVAKAQKVLKHDLLQDIMFFFSNLPFHKVITVPGKDGTKITYDIVHAWYDYNEPENSPDQMMTNIWSRNIEGNHENDHIIIHGHTPTASAIYAEAPNPRPGLITYSKNAINIDGGCVFNPRMPTCPCMLCGICLETLEEFYSDELENRIRDRESLEDFIQTYVNTENPFRQAIKDRLPG